MFVQWKSCPGLPPRPCASANIAESSSRHLQFLGQLLNLSVSNTPPFLLFRGRSTAGVTSPLFRVDFVARWSCRTISCSRSTNFSSKTRLSNWRTARLRVTWLDGNGIINGGREDGAVALRRGCFTTPNERWGASTSATLVVGGENIEGRYCIHTYNSAAKKKFRQKTTPPS